MTTHSTDTTVAVDENSILTIRNSNWTAGNQIKVDIHNSLYFNITLTWASANGDVLIVNAYIINAKCQLKIKIKYW